MYRLRVRLALVEMLLTWSPFMPNKDYQLLSLVASLMILNSNLSSITAGSLISQSLAVTQHKGLKRTQRRHAVSSSPPRLHQNQQLQLERPILLNSTKMMRKRRRTVKLEPKISKTSRNSQTFQHRRTKEQEVSPKSLKIAWLKQESWIASQWYLRISWILRIPK